MHSNLTLLLAIQNKEKFEKLEEQDEKISAVCSDNQHLSEQVSISTLRIFCVTSLKTDSLFNLLQYDLGKLYSHDLIRLIGIFNICNSAVLRVKTGSFFFLSYILFESKFLVLYINIVVFTLLRISVTN